MLYCIETGTDIDTDTNIHSLVNPLLELTFTNWVYLLILQLL